MKVKTWIEVEQEVEVEVSIADVMSSISELAESDQQPMLLSCIASVHKTLSSIPTAQIDLMNDKQLETISVAFYEQARRFRPKAAEQRTGCQSAG